MRKSLLSAALLAFCVVSADAQAQDVSAPANFGDITLSSGFSPDPSTHTLTAGGSISVNMGSCNYGNVSSRPDFKLFYTAGSTFPLYIYATSSSDITLLVNTPSGQWVCNDDGYTGLNPMLYFASPESGRYDIWVGTFSDDMSSATLYISELNPN